MQRLLKFLIEEGAKWDSDSGSESDRTSQSYPTAQLSAWLFLILFSVCWYFNNLLAHERAGVYTIVGVLLLTIAIHPFYRSHMSRGKSPLIAFGDLGRILFFVGMGFRLPFTRIPWLGLSFWALVLTPLLFTLASSASVHGWWFILKRQGTFLIAIFLALNLLNDLWVYTHYAQSLSDDLEKKTISIPVSAEQSDNPRYAAIALFHVNGMSNTGGVYGCIEKLLFNGGNGPSLQKSCCDSIVPRAPGGAFAGGECYNSNDGDEERPWKLHLKVSLPFPIALLHQVMPVGDGGSE